MNVIIEYILTLQVPAFVTSNDTKLPVVRAFMDDINLMSTSVCHTQALLNKCATALSWAGMQFRADKSRSFVIVKGRSLNTTPFCTSPPESPTDFSNYIPSIHTEPVKFLGRIIDGSLSDRRSIDELEKKLLDGLSMINKSSFKGAQKLWILQHLLIPRIQWPLLIYEVPVSKVSNLQGKISVFIRKWLGLHHTTSAICLYSSSSPCPMPIKSLLSILKRAKISGHLLLRDSSDPLISGCDIKLKSGKWEVAEAARAAETEVQYKTMCGPAQLGKSGLGLHKSKLVPECKNSHEYRKLIADTYREIDEEEGFLSKSHQLQLQGQWARWENYVKHDLSWRTIIDMPPNILSFCLASTFNVLPSPSNLKRWNVTTESSCFLCKKEICTTAHILGACLVSRDQGRFTFRHNTVLKELVTALKSFNSELPDTPPKKINSVKFVGSGGHVPKQKPSVSGILHLTNDWKFISDLEDGYQFPGHIAITSLRPDLVLYSNTLKRVILIELTCPCEENMEYWHGNKLDRYSCLCKNIRQNGWQTDLFAVEVGARGHSSRSLLSCLRTLGLTSKLAYSWSRKLAETSMHCSFLIWTARNSKLWHQEPITMSTASLPCSIPSAVVSSKSAPNLVLNNSPVVSESSSSFAQPKPIGLNNKGNTCYANSILQVLHVVPSLWCQASSEGQGNSLMCKSVASTMSHIERSRATFDPSDNISWRCFRHFNVA